MSRILLQVKQPWLPALSFGYLSSWTENPEFSSQTSGFGTDYFFPVTDLSPAKIAAFFATVAIQYCEDIHTFLQQQSGNRWNSGSGFEGLKPYVLYVSIY